MPQQPADEMVGAFVRSRLGWSDHHRENAVSVLNRYTAWLAADHPDTAPADATGAVCAGYLAARQAGTTGVIDARNGRPLGPIGGNTAHKEYQVLCWFYEWLVAEGEVPMTRRRGPDNTTIWVEPARRGPMANVTAPAQSDPDPDRIRHITDADYRTLLGSFDKRRTLDCRNAAICSLMYWSGLRRSEVARADLADYDARRGVLMVLGKNRKWRRVILLDETRQLLDRYLRRRRDDPADALFASSMAGDEAETTGRLKPDAISGVLERRCRRLGIDVSAHQFRRASTISAKRRGIPETEIARQQGWAPQSAKLMLPRYTADQADELVEEAYRSTDPTVGRTPRTRRLRAV
jgi:integrase